MENITDEELKVAEKTLLTNHLKREHFEIFLWPGNSKDILDTKILKLIIEQSQKGEKCKELLENYGERPRVYRNTLIFLCPMNSERINFESFLKRKLAWQLVEGDKNIGLTFEQRREVKEKLKKAENEVKELLRNLYRIVLLPSKDKFTEIDLGIPTYGAETTIDREIYERLRSEGQILEKLAPLSLREKYLSARAQAGLKDRDYVETKNILESFFKTPGEIRIVSDEVLKTCIKEGVRQGLFGLGDVEEGKTICRHFKVECTPELTEGEILISADLCKLKEIISVEKLQAYEKKIQETQTIKSLNTIAKEISSYSLSTSQKGKIEDEIKRKRDELGGTPPLPPRENYQEINLKLNVPTGKLSDIVRMIPYLKSKFNQVKVKVEISAQDGNIVISDYEDKIEEAINQANITVEEKKVE
jgi:hypothetical protein